MKRLLYILCCVSLIFIFASCEDPAPTPPQEVIITATSTNVIPPTKTILFTANAAVDWEVPDTSGGSITSEGIYTAPAEVGSYNILAISKEDPSVRETYRIYVTNFHELFNKMKSGRHVLYFRHTLANVGQDLLVRSGEWWRYCNVDSARQIAPEGIEDSRKIGQVLAGMEIPIDSAIVSEFCRCRMTVDSMELGLKLNLSPSLTFFVYGEAERHARTLRVITRQNVGRGRNMMVVAHSYAAGSTFPAIAQGDMDLFEPKGDGNDPEYVGRIPLSAFLELAMD